MSFALSQLFPGVDAGLNRIGFLFGAGTSKEAGFPLMSDLTKQIISILPESHKATLDEILNAQALIYDPAVGTPNIEVLSDLVSEHVVATRESKYADLASKIRELIVEAILSVANPDITHHVRFLEGLRRRAHGTSTTVTILTTNYDILFELEASEVGVRVETGLDGSLRRVFKPAVFDLVRGTIDKTRFTHRRELHVNIIKLHGSVSWFRRGNKIFESGLKMENGTAERALVLPRRQKVIETLSEPFDQLFTRASRTLGSSCQFVVACGFSFSDKHINDQLIFPKLNDGKFRLTALCGEEPGCFDRLRAFPAFQAGLPTNCFIDQKDTGTGTDLWKFSALAQLIEP